ncbi:hypothetical protein RCL1_001118 [Eukaryota sp. TZLM3-RCL]
MADRLSEELYLQIEEFERDKRRIERQLFEEHERQKNLQTELMSTQLQLQQSEEREKELLAKTNEMQATISTLKDEQIQLKTEMKKIKVQSSYLADQAETERVNCRESKKLYAKQLEEINSKLKQYHEFYTSQSLAQEVSKLQSENEQLKQRLEQASLGDNSTDQLITQIDQVTQQKDTIKNDLEKAIKELEDIKSANHELMNELSNKQNKSESDANDAALQEQILYCERLISQSSYAIDLIHDNVCQNCQEIVKAALQQAQDDQSAPREEMAE